MPTLALNSGSLYYEVHGKGAPLLLVAGYSCDHSFWRPVISTLSQHFQVVIFDNLGIGQSSSTAVNLSIESMAEGPLKLINELGLNRPTLVGHSMGGMIAQYIAHQHPDRIKHLVLVNTATTMNPRSLFALWSYIHLIQALAPIDEVIEASMPLFFSNTFLSNPKNVPAYQAELKANPTPPSIECLENQLNALKGFCSSKWIGTIKTPTHIISAKEDICCTPLNTQQLHKKIPHSTFQEVEGAHCWISETPNTFVECLKHLLKP